MLVQLLTPVRTLRTALARWSVADDRAFHDGLFEAHQHDPFVPSYVGYVTIRRFADLASLYMHGCEHVLDLGCGPGEITCELAMRFPAVQFVGVDHSASAIARACENAGRLALSNVRFAQADIATFNPAQRPGVVLMFDAFHHVVDPAGFVRRLSEFTDRCFLIEPAGDALGGWRRTIDFDWVPAELDKIRARVEHQLGHPRVQIRPADGRAGEPAGRAVEHRYPLEDYARFFRGFSLEARGTVAGFDVYPPAPAYDSAWRRELMSVAYHLLTEVDDALLASGQDLYAKHWAIYATRHQTELRLASRTAEPAPSDTGAEAAMKVEGPFDASYENVEGPLEFAPDVSALVEVTIVNRSWREWSSDGTTPIHLSHHWQTSRREAVAYEGLRTRLPGPLLPGAARRVAMAVRTPKLPGKYLLEIDLVEEGVTWFSAAGIAPLRVPVRVR